MGILHPHRAAGVGVRLSHTHVFIAQSPRYPNDFFEFSGEFAKVWTLIDGRRSISKISKRLGLDRTRVEAVLQRFKQLGLVEY
jgi:hypothetical protein